MTEPVWALRPRPVPGPRARLLGRWAPDTATDLTAHRLELSATLRDAALPPGDDGAAHPPGDDGAADRLLLAFEELASNGLRHGRPPVRVQVTEFDDQWLLEVSDAAGDRPPVPAVGRDAALGGLGLPLVARLCGAYGWVLEEGRKTVWARIDRRRPAPEASVPQPRDSIEDPPPGT